MSEKISNEEMEKVTGGRFNNQSCIKGNIDFTNCLMTSTACNDFEWKDSWKGWLTGEHKLCLACKYLHNG